MCEGGGWEVKLAAGVVFEAVGGKYQVGFLQLSQIKLSPDH